MIPCPLYCVPAHRTQQCKCVQQITLQNVIKISRLLITYCCCKAPHCKLTRVSSKLLDDKFFIFGELRYAIKQVTRVTEYFNIVLFHCTCAIHVLVNLLHVTHDNDVWNFIMHAHIMSKCVVKLGTN